MQGKTPHFKIAISGHGTAGKDLAGDILGELTTLRYVAGTSKFAADVVFDAWGKQHYSSIEECWRDRHNYRTRWAEEIGKYNSNDPVALYRRCLDNQDMLTGIRWRHELQAVRAAKLVDLWIWIERDVPPDPTQQYGPEECDIIIDNNGTIGDLRRKLHALAKTWGVLKEPV